MAESTRRGTDRRGIRAVARRRDHPGGGRLDPRHGVPAVLRGQRTNRTALPGRARRAAGDRGRTAAGVLRAEPGQDRPGLDHRRIRRAGGRITGGGRAVRPGAQPDVADHPVARRRQGPAGLLAHPRRGRELPGRARLRGRGLEHPLPRRPLPGPVRIREEDLRAAADPGVRRGVHPRPDAHASDRRVRPGTRPPARPPRPAPPPPRDRPHLRVGPLPARRFRAPAREMGTTSQR